MIPSFFSSIIPEAILGVAACVLFLGATFKASRHLWAALALAALGLAGCALYLTSSSAGTASAAAVFTSPIVLDHLALIIKVIALAGGVVHVLFSWHEVPEGQAGEYHACLLLIIAGLCLTGAANELVTLFLALELISIPTYVLLYLPRSDKPAQEAAMKYFLLSIFSSALLLFGFSYLYGLSGTTNLPALTAALAQAGSGSSSALVAVALVMVVAGLGFRITAVPFHFYAPDVYQGTTPAAAGLLAFVPKVAGFVALMRLLGFAPVEMLTRDALRGLTLDTQVATLLWILAAVTMLIGNVLALLQDNVRRLLAYSSVAHAGYMLMGLAATPYLLEARAGRMANPSFSTEVLPGGVEAVLFYLVAYGAMTVGAFAVLSYLSTPRRPVETVDDLAGLSRSHPGVALLMMVFLFSLIGIPLTAGFAGKLLLFFATILVPTDGPQGWRFQILALIGAINAAVGAWYYLRIVAVMYLRSPIKPLEKPRAWPVLAAVLMCAIITLAVGIYPWPLLNSLAVSR